MASPVRLTASRAHSCPARASISATVSASRCSGTHVGSPKHSAITCSARVRALIAASSARARSPMPRHHGQQHPRVRHPPRVRPPVRHRRRDQGQRAHQLRAPGGHAERDHPAQRVAQQVHRPAAPGQEAHQRVGVPGRRVVARRQRPGQPETRQVDGGAGGPGREQPGQVGPVRRRAGQAVHVDRGHAVRAGGLPHVQRHPAGGQLVPRPRQPVRVALPAARPASASSGPVSSGLGGVRRSANGRTDDDVAVDTFRGSLVDRWVRQSRCPDAHPVTEIDTDGPLARCTHRATRGCHADGVAAGGLRGRAGPRLRCGLEPRHRRRHTGLDHGRPEPGAVPRPDRRPPLPPRPPVDAGPARSGRHRGRLHPGPADHHVRPGPGRGAGLRRHRLRRATGTRVRRTQRAADARDRGAPRRGRLPAPAAHARPGRAVAGAAGAAGGRDLPALRRLRADRRAGAGAGHRPVRGR